MGTVIDLDIAPLIFAPMAQVRARMLDGGHGAKTQRLFALVLRDVVRMLIEDLTNPEGTQRRGLHPHNAGRRAIELLDLADELEVCAAAETQ